MTLEFLDLIANAVLMLGAFGAAVFCFVLSRRIKALNQFDTGLGSAIAVLSSQVDAMEKSVKNAELSAKTAAEELRQLVIEANEAATQLDLSIATADTSEPFLEPAPDQPIEPDVATPAFRSWRSAS